MPPHKTINGNAYKTDAANLYLEEDELHIVWEIDRN